MLEQHIRERGEERANGRARTWSSSTWPLRARLPVCGEAPTPTIAVPDEVMQHFRLTYFMACYI
jgi:hypothetical protein